MLQNEQREFFFYTHPKYRLGGPHDLAVGATNDSLGLGDQHFARLYRGSSVFQGPVTYAAATKTLQVNAIHYGGGAIHQWYSVNAWQGLCAGDSGAPGFRNSGTFVSGKPKWQSVPLLAVTVDTDNPLPGPCHNNGGFAYVAQDLAWIKSIVEFWPRNTYTCLNSTSDSGDPVSSCWRPF